MSRFLGGASEGDEMPHFTAWPGIGFSIEMQLHIGQGKGCDPVWFAVSPEVPEKIDHGRGPERFGAAEGKPANGAELLLKLARDTGVE